VTLKNASFATFSNGPGVSIEAVVKARMKGGVSSTIGGTFDGIVITGNYLFVGVGTSTFPAISLTNCTNVMVSGNGWRDYASLLQVGTGVTFQPLYMGPDLRFVPITGGAKIQVRDAGTNAWVDADQWTNP
jgi:hypothetical protein